MLSVGDRRAKEEGGAFGGGAVLDPAPRRPTIAHVRAVRVRAHRVILLLYQPASFVQVPAVECSLFFLTFHSV